ncbi:MAG: sulfatase [Planctomycetota bacterium]|nr:sulfatase [Planctomycetota bacterium]
MKASHKWGGLALFAIGLGACGGGGADEQGTSAAATSRGRGPVVLFVVDTLRADHLGCYGYEPDTSPALDRLAAEGVLFEACQAQSSWTKPATASVLTGLLPSQHGAVHKVSALPPEHLLLAEPLGAAGYATAAFGGNGFIFGTEQGFSRGFDTFHSGVDLQGDGNEQLIAEADLLVDGAIDWLDGHMQSEADQPFFLYVHVIDPHDPYAPPPDLVHAFGEPLAPPFPTDAELARPGPVVARYPGGVPDVVQERMRQLYDGEIAGADRAFGRLLESLERHGVYDEATIVFVSDHGEEFFDHGGVGHNPLLYQEVIQVPLVVKFPTSLGDALPGQRFAPRVRQVDVLPTLLDTLGIELEPERAAQLAGQSLVPALLGEASWGEQPAVTEVDYEGVYRKSLIQGGTKYVRTWAPRLEERLFDLEADPGETRNLVAEQPGRVAELRADLGRLSSLGGRGWGFVMRNETELTVGIAGLITFRGDALAGLDPLGLELEGFDAALADGPLGQGWVEFTKGTDGKRNVRYTLGEPSAEGQPGDAAVGTEHYPGFDPSGMPSYEGRGAWFLTTLAPGDEDGVSFMPAPGTEDLRLMLWADGEPVPPEFVFLGPGLERAGAMPLALGTGEGLELPGTPPRSTVPEGAPLHGWLWKNMDPATLDVELSPETEANLRDLGYFGDD